MSIIKQIDTSHNMAAFAGSLDANVLLRLLLNDIPDQHAAVVKLLGTHASQFAIADTAIIEVVFVLKRHYQFTRLQIVESVEGLMSLANINCGRALFQKALPLYRQNSSLSFVDCCLSVYAELNHAIPLWTFDRKLANQADTARLIAR